jgi:hypothetical protein
MACKATALATELYPRESENARTNIAKFSKGCNQPFFILYERYKTRERKVQIGAGAS